MDLNKEFITVCVPTFNSGVYLDQCLQCISRTTENYLYIREILFCDNNSTDNTIEIINSFINCHDKARIISREDSGQSNAINKAISVAQGDYFIWLNSDDIIFENFFSRVFEVYINNLPTKYFTITADSIQIDSNSNLINRSPSMPDTPQLVQRGVWFGSFPCRVFLSSTLKELRLNEEFIYCMDLELMHRASLISFPAEIKYSYNIYEFLGCFRNHSESKTTSGKYKILILSEGNKIVKSSKFVSILKRYLNLYYLFRRFIKPTNYGKSRK
jgi:glycosyltransferase involved in cell wall biosynthesis